MEKSKKILIIIEDTHLEFTLVRILERGGYQVVCTAQSQSASIWDDNAGFDLLIVDCSGRWDACSCKVIDICSLYVKQPILFLTTDHPETGLEEIEGFRKVEIIQKPFDPPLIIVTIKKLLNP